FAAFLNVEWGIPLKSVVFVAWNAKRPTMTVEQWMALSGHVGHQHAPENHHTDPGELDMVRVLWHAQQWLDLWEREGYPYENLPAPVPIPGPEPEPVPIPVPEPVPTPAPAPTP